MSSTCVFICYLIFIQFAFQNCHIPDVSSKQYSLETINPIELRQSNATLPTSVPPAKPSHFALELLISFLSSLSQMISPISGLAGAFLNSTISGLLTASIVQLESISRDGAKGMFLIDVPGQGQFVLAPKKSQTYPDIASVLRESDFRVENDFHNMNAVMQLMMHSRVAPPLKWIKIKINKWSCYSTKYQRLLFKFRWFKVEATIIILLLSSC